MNTAPFGVRVVDDRAHGVDSDGAGRLLCDAMTVTPEIELTPERKESSFIRRTKF